MGVTKNFKSMTKIKQLNRKSIKGLQNEGVYRIFLYKDGKPSPLDRLVKTDYSGLFYIGSTERTVEERLGEFLRGMNLNNNDEYHSGSMKIRRNTVLLEFVLEHSLYFSFEYCNVPKGMEDDLLKEYSQEFGEKPPLNG
jgi:hypothetical protein